MRKKTIVFDTAWPLPLFVWLFTAGSVSAATNILLQSEALFSDAEARGIVSNAVCSFWPTRNVSNWPVSAVESNACIQVQISRNVPGTEAADCEWKTWVVDVLIDANAEIVCNELMTDQAIYNLVQDSIVSHFSNIELPVDPQIVRVGDIAVADFGFLNDVRNNTNSLERLVEANDDLLDTIEIPLDSGWREWPGEGWPCKAVIDQQQQRIIVWHIE